MAYCLADRETLPSGLKRIAREQADAALASLTDPAADRAAAVHDARKRFKKIRAVLRLVRDAIGDDYYRRENGIYRDLGRRLAPVRESAAAVETVDRLALDFGEQLAPGAFVPIRERLLGRQHALERALFEEQDVLGEVTAVLTTASRAMADWPIAGCDFELIQPGLQRIYRRGRNRLADAYGTPTPESFHEWRKRVKYLWYAARILQPIWPAGLDLLVTELDRLASDLGYLHDLAELPRLLADLPEPTTPADNDLLLAMADRQQAWLVTAVRPLGERLFAEKPAAFSRRLEAYWDIWCWERGG